MFWKFVCGITFSALALLSAATGYNVTFYNPVTINGTMLQPGDYRLELKDNTAILTQGKIMAQAPVKVENSDKKFPTNTVRLDGTRLEEIRLGGTKMRLVFQKTGNATN